MACARSMPRVPRSSLVGLAATPDAVGAAAVERLGAIPAGDGTFEVPPPPDQQPSIALAPHVAPAGGGAEGSIRSTGAIDMPFFGWFFVPLIRIAHRRART